MNNQVVVDTNVLVALIDSRDKWHSNAKKVVAALETRQMSVIYLDCVINETISVLARRAEEQKRTDQFPALLDALIQLVPVDSITWVSAEVKRLYPQIVELVRDTSGILNFHDALMALFCQEISAVELVSFDEDFDRISWLSRVSLPEENK